MKDSEPRVPPLSARYCWPDPPRPASPPEQNESLHEPKGCAPAVVAVAAAGVAATVVVRLAGLLLTAAGGPVLSWRLSALTGFVLLATYAAVEAAKEL